jgi:hypothetical protein
MVDDIGLSVDDYDLITADQQAFFFTDPSTPVTWADYATFYAAVSAEPWFNVGSYSNIVGNATQTLVYEGGTDSATIAKAAWYLKLVAGDIGPYPWPDPEPLATPNWYVDSAATGTGTGLSWANAFTTVLAAYTAASTGEVVEISGGVSGKTYDIGVNQGIYAGITVQGSKSIGHDGLVTLSGMLYPRDTVGVKIVNLQHTATNPATTTYAVRYLPGAVVEFIDCIIGPYYVSSLPQLCQGATITWTRCKLKRVAKATPLDASFIYCGAVSYLTIDNCLMDYSGKVSMTVAGSSLTVRKSLILNTGDTSPTAPWANVGDSALTDVLLTDTAFFGCYPLATGGDSRAPVCTNVFWHKTAYMTGVGGDIATFDSSNRAIITNGMTNQLPYFTAPRNTPIGELIVRYDDRNNLTVSRATAAVLNPEVVLSHAIDCHGRKPQNRPTAQNIDDMRTLIANGNEVSSHAATHSNASHLNFITISASGTSPILDISTTNTGDSTTWTGTLTITINGTPQAFDLVNASYDSLGVLVAALNGLIVGDGTVTAAVTNAAQNSAYLPACVLAPVTGQGISSSYVMQMDDAAFVGFETAEAILDLEAYINSGTDRNGANAVTGMAVDPPSTTYVCKTYAAPYGLGRASVATELQNNPNIVAANQSSGGINISTMYFYGSNVDMYNFPYLQMGGTTLTEDLFALACYSTSSPRITLPLWHGGTPKFNDTLEGFKALLLHFGLGSRTFAEWANYIRTDGAWTIIEPKAAFTGNPDDYLSQGDYTLLSNSPLKGAGKYD